VKLLRCVCGAEIDLEFKSELGPPSEEVLKLLTQHFWDLHCGPGHGPVEPDKALKGSK
jgi:hypothetical protein